MKPSEEHQFGGGQVASVARLLSRTIWCKSTNGYSEQVINQVSRLSNATTAALPYPTKRHTHPLHVLYVLHPILFPTLSRVLSCFVHPPLPCAPRNAAHEILVGKPRLRSVRSTYGAVMRISFFDIPAWTDGMLFYFYDDAGRGPGATLNLYVAVKSHENSPELASIPFLELYSLCVLRTWANN
jgi:hypothetical protein